MNAPRNFWVGHSDAEMVAAAAEYLSVAFAKDDGADLGVKRELFDCAVEMVDDVVVRRPAWRFDR